MSTVKRININLIEFTYYYCFYTHSSACSVRRTLASSLEFELDIWRQKFYKDFWPDRFYGMADLLVKSFSKNNAREKRYFSFWGVCILINSAVYEESLSTSIVRA